MAEAGTYRDPETYNLLQPRVGRYEDRLTRFSHCFGCGRSARHPCVIKHRFDCPTLFVNDAPYAFWLGASHG